MRPCYGYYFITFHVMEICKPLVVYRFYCMALFHSQTLHHMIKQTTEGDEVRNIFSYLESYVQYMALGMRFCCLSYDVMSGSDIMPCIKIDKPLVIYRFW